MQKDTNILGLIYRVKMSLHFIKIKNAYMGITSSEQHITVVKLNEASAPCCLFVFTVWLVQKA